MQKEHMEIESHTHTYIELTWQPRLAFSVCMQCVLLEYKSVHNAKIIMNRIYAKRALSEQSNARTIKMHLILIVDTQ